MRSQPDFKEFGGIGLAFTYSFVDNEVYGTDDINDITRCLTGAGVAPFVAKDSYSVSDLNALTKEVATAGVSLDGCKCIAYNPGTTEMTVTVGAGIVFFDSGVRLMIDDDGYSLPVSPNTDGYVLAYFSPTLQRVDVIFDTKLPSTGEYVVLAEVEADGNLRDKREFTRSKIATIGSNALIERSFVTMENTLVEINGEKLYTAAYIPDVDLSRFNYALLIYGELTQNAKPPTMCLYDLRGETLPVSISSHGEAWVNNQFETVITYILSYRLEVYDGKLCILADCNENYKQHIAKDFSAYRAILM